MPPQPPVSILIVLVAFVMFAVGCRVQSSTTPPPSNLKTDEHVQLYPTAGYFDEQANAWLVDVHGKAYEPEESSAKRAALIALIRSSIRGGGGEADGAFLDARIRPFLVDNERGKSVTISLSDETFAAGSSAANGHFTATLALATATADPQRQSVTLETRVVMPKHDSRSFVGRVHLIPPRGYSVISDIDDTIKQSQVTDKSELLKNTFLREFRAVDGMPELYRILAGTGASVHYVSSSPWQLYQPLDGFLEKAGFPQGTLHLKHFRLKDSSALDLLGSQTDTKLKAISPILERFPERRFVLIGDSGEQDPEIYGQIAREHPEQVVGIFIRNVTSATSDDERFLAAFRDLPNERWELFEDASQISEQIQSRIQQPQL